jgi:hypothetical protein
MLSRAHCVTLLTSLTTAPAASASLVQVLRLVQSALTDEALVAVESVDPAHELAVRACLQASDPTPPADAATVEYPVAVQSLREAVDRELSRWVSRTNQPIGPSGQVALAEG